MRLCMCAWVTAEELLWSKRRVGESRLMQQGQVQNEFHVGESCFVTSVVDATQLKTLLLLLYFSTDSLLFKHVMAPKCFKE